MEPKWTQGTPVEDHKSSDEPVVRIIGTIKSHSVPNPHDGEEVALLLKAHPYLQGLDRFDIKSWAGWFESYAQDRHDQAEDLLSQVEWELKRIEADIIAQTAPKVSSYHDYKFGLSDEHFQTPLVRRYLELQLMAAHHRNIVQRFAPIYWWMRGFGELRNADCAGYVEEFFIMLDDDPALKEVFDARFTRQQLSDFINDMPDEE